jgi:hypothetical protein
MFILALPATSPVTSSPVYPPTAGVIIQLQPPQYSNSQFLYLQNGNSQFSPPQYCNSQFPPSQYGNNQFLPSQSNEKFPPP